VSDERGGRSGPVARSCKAGRVGSYDAQAAVALANMGLSQRAAARLLGIDERTMRKYVAGDLVIPEMLVWALRAGPARAKSGR
jgi:hypothetical protein